MARKIFATDQGIQGAGTFTAGRRGTVLIRDIPVIEKQEMMME